MLGFGNRINPSINVDWSLYGGAEQTAPPQMPFSATPAHSTIPPRPSTLASLSSRSASASSLSSSSSRSSSPSRLSPSILSSTTSLPSDHDDDDDAKFYIQDHDDEDVQVARLVGGTPKANANAKSKAKPEANASASASTAPAGKQWLPPILEPPQDPNDFLWMLTEEPHRSRRRAILAAHPEVRTLMGREPLTKYVSFCVTALQVALAVGVARYGWHPLSWRFLALAYVVGGTANQNTFLAIHEITHNLAFRGIRANRAWAILVNCCIGVPYAMAFKPYHLEHHKYLGEDGVDTDLPTRLELVCLNNVFGKAFFATFQIFFYALRPGFVRAQRPTVWHLANVVVQLVFDAVLVRMCGWTALVYLLASSFFAGSLHPCAAHFIAEHYMFGGIAQETWSYYGWLNVLAYNVGYHNEHHDFPSIAWTRLPALRAMAPEYYDVLPHHTSWPMVTVQFILGTDSGLFARIKRVNRDKERCEARAQAKVKAQ
ncbi:sphingolipid delta-4 desaturase [Thecaphora frezii]